MLAMLALPTHLRAQTGAWEPVYTVPPGQTAYSFNVRAVADSGFVMLSAGYNLISDDAGATWRQSPLPILVMAASAASRE